MSGGSARYPKVCTSQEVFEVGKKSVSVSPCSGNSRTTIRTTAWREWAKMSAECQDYAGVELNALSQAAASAPTSTASDAEAGQSNTTPFPTEVHAQ